jgi:hypothetical protein
MKTRTVLFSGNDLTLEELREWVMISLADLDGDCRIVIKQNPGGMNGMIASTEFKVYE